MATAKETITNVGENVNWRGHYGKQYEDSPKKLKTELPYDLTVPLPGI